MCRRIGLMLLVLSAAVLRAEPAVVIGSFADVQNASTLQQAASSLELVLPVREIRTVAYDGGDGVLHRVVVLPLDASETPKLRQAVQEMGYGGAWVAEVIIQADESPLPAQQRSATPARDAMKTPAAAATGPPMLPLYRDNPVLSEPGVAPKSRSWFKGDTSLTFRLKGFASASIVPGTDVYREPLGSRRNDSTVDLRTMLQHDVGPWSFEAAHTTLVQHGDAILLGQTSSGTEQVVVSDDLRLLNLTDEWNEGRRHRTLHRLDRLNAQWRSNHWAVTVGRQAVSWGSGIVFQPLDPFNPFAPTAVDRDYKAGDDLVLIERLFDNGHDAQLLHVFRRDRLDSVNGDVASTAAKWHGYSGSLEFEVIAAQHYDTEFLGLSGRVPVGPAVLRSDIAMRRGISRQTLNDDWGVLGVINIDVAFPWRGRTVYAFAEYFHNDFGLAELPTPLTALPADLQAGLERGEFFNLMRDYLAVGGTFEWHPLLTQQLTVITNLHDSSSLLQMQFAYDVGQNQNMQLGWIGSTGGSGDEFAPITVGMMPAGPPLTQGGGDRVYLRWAGYF